MNPQAGLTTRQRQGEGTSAEEEEAKTTYRLMGQPLMPNDYLFMSPIQPPHDPTRLEVPKDHISLSISGTEESTIGTEARFAGITGDGVTCETFFAL